MIDSTGIPLSLACPSGSQCTTVDANGAEITFDPLAPAKRTSTEIDPHGVLLSVQCPGGSTTWCVAVDTSGNAIGFDPTGAAATDSECVAIDAHGDEARSTPRA